ncbi:MAG: Cation efflux protein [candidate division CPR2 bacterium GW2011_GWC1_39_9]|uniref:Cation efflux protein n=1 Tax=candidate division CPR2 bacterium GW2011_GWC2_39_10 TaxID=1618345 RepID=A0A0G0LTM3_UNCC2|nr:MAG: Cation efflux protein [candidate division CPR2 bacterium GW2011_GWC2_39_10]KKR36065.1 MAG: Cation efflux protein [candidate division CPR2 bacterium GW2011_GWC1_39_9]
MINKRPVGFKSVLLAVIGNSLVALLKLVGFAFSGSAVMLSEGIHSIADAANQALLMVGIKRGEKPADDKFNYGYRQERFFWALVSACGIFFLGAGVTIYHGINSLLHHETTHLSSWIFLILLLSFIFESYTLYVAFCELKINQRRGSIINHLRNSADPTVLAVIFEDSAALLGIVIAFISLMLAQITGIYYFDGIGSIFIGLLLGFVAITLIKINKDYLMNKAVPKHVQKEIFSILKKQSLIESVHDLKTTVITTDGYRVKAEIEIDGRVLAKKNT